MGVATGQHEYKRTTVEGAAVCDACGKPATQWARDILQHEAPGQNFIEYSPLDISHYGCEDHPVKSETHRTQLPR